MSISAPGDIFCRKEKTMPVGLFLDKEHRPTGREIERALGRRYVLFQTLVDFMKRSYQLKGEWIFGGKNYGWNLWFRRSGKTLLNLFPQDGFPVAQVVLGKEQVKKARSLKLGKHVAEVFSKAAQFHDGRWLYAPVKTAKDAADIQELIALKRKPAPEK
jgi:hypothetical protein